MVDGIGTQRSPAITMPKPELLAVKVEEPMSARQPLASPRLVAVVAALVITTVLFSACGRAAAPSSPAGSDPNVAPDFKVRTLASQDFVLSQQRGKPVVLFFIAAWCASCYPKANALGQLYESYKNQGLQVLIVDVDPSEGPADLRLFKQRAKGSDHHWALDKNQLVTQLYKVLYLDTTVIIDRQGRIVFNGQFPFDKEELVQLLSKAM